MAKIERDARTPIVPTRFIGVPAPNRESAGGFLVAGINSTQDILISHVIGNKLDDPVITPTADASIIGYLKGLVSALGEQYDIAQNQVSKVDVDNFGLFEIAIMDKDSGLIPAADITIGTYQLDRIRAGVTTTIVAAGVMTVANGRAFLNYQFTAANWQPDDAYVVRINPAGGMTAPLEVVIGTNTYYPPVFPWFGIVDEVATGAGTSPDVTDVVIYPAADELGAAVITDDGTSPAFTAGNTTISAAFVSASSHLINFEPNQSVEVISIYAECIWHTQGPSSESKIQLTNDGGATWTDITDVFANAVPAVYTSRTRRGVGLWFANVVVGTDQLGFRLVHRSPLVSGSTAQLRSDSYIRITYRKV